MKVLFNYYAEMYDRIMAYFKLDSIEVILRMMGDIQGKKILDIGGGTGKLADALIKSGGTVVIVDPSPQMTQQAKRRNPKVHIYTQTIESFEQPQYVGDFDFIIMRGVLRHIEHPEQALTKVDTYLHNKGSLLIWENDHSHWKSKCIALLERLCVKKCDGLTKESLMALCERTFVPNYMSTMSDHEMLYEGKKLTRK